MAKHKDDPPALEWAFGAVGAFLFVTLLAVLLHASVTRAGAPPDIRVRTESVAPVANGYVLTFEATNVGDQTAAEVEITAAVIGGERASARLDYLAPRATRRGGVFLQSDPREGAVTLRAEGYAEP